MAEVLAFLAALREVHPDMDRWGLHGGCFRVYLVLKQRFPDAQPWYDSNHVLTKIGDAFYDIRGQVEPVSEVGAQYLPMDPLVFNRAYTWQADAICSDRAMAMNAERYLFLRRSKRYGGSDRHCLEWYLPRRYDGADLGLQLDEAIDSQISRSGPGVIHG